MTDVIKDIEVVDDNEEWMDVWVGRDNKGYRLSNLKLILSENRFQYDPNGTIEWDMSDYQFITLSRSKSFDKTTQIKCKLRNDISVLYQAGARVNIVNTNNNEKEREYYV